MLIQSQINQCYSKASWSQFTRRVQSSLSFILDSYMSSEVALKWVKNKEPVVFTRKIQLSGYHISIDGSYESFLDYDSSRE